MYTLVHLLVCFCEVCEETRQGTHAKTRRMKGPCSCEAGTLPTAPPCQPHFQEMKVKLDLNIVVDNYLFTYSFLWLGQHAKPSPDLSTPCHSSSWGYPQTFSNQQRYSIYLSSRSWVPGDILIRSSQIAPLDSEIFADKHGTICVVRPPAFSNIYQEELFFYSHTKKKCSL